MAPSGRAPPSLPGGCLRAARLGSDGARREGRAAHCVMHVEAQVTASGPEGISNDRQLGSVSSCMGRGPIAQDALSLRLCGSARRSLWLRRADGPRSKNPWSVPSGDRCGREAQPRSSGRVRHPGQAFTFRPIRPIQPGKGASVRRKTAGDRGPCSARMGSYARSAVRASVGGD